MLFPSLEGRLVGGAALLAFTLATATASAQSSDAPSQPNAPGGTSGAAGAGTPTAGPDNLLPTDPTAVTPTTSQPAPDPKADQQKLIDQGKSRPTNDGSIGARPSEVYSEDWWAHTRPILELHGYFRTRGELYHNF